MLRHKRFIDGQALFKKKAYARLSLIVRRLVSYDQHESPTVPHNNHSTPNLNLTDRLPSSCQILIAGGGIIGQSIAYHLTQMGVKDVVLIEKAK